MFSEKMSSEISSCVENILGENVHKEILSVYNLLRNKYYVKLSHIFSFKVMIQILHIVACKSIVWLYQYCDILTTYQKYSWYFTTKKYSIIFIEVLFYTIFLCYLISGSSLLIYPSSIAENIIYFKYCRMKYSILGINAKEKED